MIVLAVTDLYGIHGRRDELIALLGRSERAASGEAGCRRYTFAATLADPDRFVLVSEWENEEALEAHYASRAFADFQFGLDGLLARPSEMTAYTISGAVRPVDSRPMDPRDAD
jgi:quinol monooxygenase YgiN